MLVAVALFTVIGLAAVGFWASQPDYQVLYTGLTPEDAGQVLEYLKKNGIPHQIGAGGAVIEVPSERVYEARMELATQGLPAGGNVGFEVFDRSSLPGTEFTNNVNYQRALQGEMARTIAQLDQIVAARVHIALPSTRLYAPDDSTPTASVVLQLRPGASLSTEQVQGIAHLVASAVEGLNAANVTIVDTTGNTLAQGGAGPGDPGALTTDQLAVVAKFEHTIQTHIQRMLDAALGRSKSVVTVRAELDFDVQETTQEKYEPPAADRGYVKHEQVSQEDYQGAASGPAGAPGMDSNVLGGAPSGIAAGNAGKFSSTNRTVEYQLSKSIETMRKAPGRIKRLCVAAIVDESVGAAQIAAVRNLIEAAAGIDVERGDTLRVESMKMAAAEDVEEDLEAEERQIAAQRRWRFIIALARYVAITLAGLLIFKAGDSILRRIQTMAQPLTTTQQPPSDAAQAEEAAVQPPAAVDQPEQPPQAPSLPLDLQNDPQRVARQLTAWLDGSEQPGSSSAGEHGQT